MQFDPLDDWDDDDQVEQPAGSYILGEADHEIIVAAIRLSLKLLGSDLPEAPQRKAIAQIGLMLSQLPAPADEPMQFTLYLTAPERPDGACRVIHAWEIAIDGREVRIGAGGMFHGPAGPDSFTALGWRAAPGYPAENPDYLSRLGIIQTAAPFPAQVAAIDLEEPGFALGVILDGDEIPPDGDEEDEDDFD